MNLKPLIALSTEYKSTVRIKQNSATYYGKYTLGADQNWYSDTFTLTIDGNQLLYNKGNSVKNFEIKNQGVYSRTDNGIVFKYQKYYLVNKKQYLLVSHRKEIKHNGVFYYRIIIDGQTQLAL
ncbi:hypothetical protein EV200_108207 [Pedobacter psychrotolerans]|uniref:Uncharacterized protein n=2 Tax=Pedobacter psychrotolerans TaxID=1843235 RepID=A0A4R2H5J2_9SPHI|nr:hypothetical protein EV200_108207 [Pedobacter psychrotolerans]GGE67933.1 hypothetical protein GCM10011413_38240 [Pedobacter psychrotolerans]